MSNGTQAIDRAAEMLSMVVRAEESVSFTEVVDQTGLARSTASRLLQALERNGLLERDREGLFRGGALFAHYAARFDRVETLVAAAQPMLERIGEATGETVNLAVPRGDTVVQVAQIDSTFVLGAMKNWLDVEVPAHCSALGKVMYAYGALELPTGPLERPTATTVSDLDELKAELDRVRDRGYAVTLGELEEGLDGLAAPVRGADGHVHASMGISGPSFRVRESHEEIGKLLVDESGRLSRVLGRRARKESAR